MKDFFGPFWRLGLIDGMALLSDLFDLQGDVNPEEILFLSGLLPGEAAWRFLLSYRGKSLLQGGEAWSRWYIQHSYQAVIHIFKDVKKWYKLRCVASNKMF